MESEGIKGFGDKILASIEQKLIDVAQKIDLSTIKSEDDLYDYACDIITREWNDLSNNAKKIFLAYLLDEQNIENIEELRGKLQRELQIRYRKNISEKDAVELFVLFDVFGLLRPMEIFLTYVEGIDLFRAT